jgi:transposase
MDRLLERQAAIQATLARTHLKNGQLVLYDITSSYFEGAYEGSELVSFGYNRDGKKGHEQVVIGLLCSAEGCPVGVELFPGKTQDATTVIGKIDQVQKEYGIQEVVFVGDRGMITQANAAALKDRPGLHTITALTHRQIVQLLERKVIQAELFDERNIVEVIDPQDPKRRYCLCRNPRSGQRESATRQRLLDLTRAQLERVAKNPRRASGEKLGERVGRILGKYKMGKFVKWEVKDGRLEWRFEQEAIAAEKVFDGCYIVTSNVSAERMDKQAMVAAYKDLGLVEQAFRSLKTVQLEVRPVYHKKDDRIRAHVFLCVLGYYLQWHLNQRLQPLFETDGQGKDRQWTFSKVLERLKAIRRDRVKMGAVEFERVTEPAADQKRILELAGVSL